MCKICDEEPNSHSFNYYGITNDNIYIYYTCPAEATKYWDTNGILEHYTEVLEQNNNHKWIWLFNAKGFTTKHSLEMTTAMGILKIIAEHNDSLCEIRIVNANMYIKGFYSMIHRLLSPDLISKIKWIQ